MIKNPNMFLNELSERSIFHKQNSNQRMSAINKLNMKIHFGWHSILRTINYVNNRICMNFLKRFIVNKETANSKNEKIFSISLNSYTFLWSIAAFDFVCNKVQFISNLSGRIQTIDLNHNKKDDFYGFLVKPEISETGVNVNYKYFNLNSNRGSLFGLS